jgi:hypothetical protein
LVPSVIPLLGFEYTGTKRRWGDALRAREATIVLYLYNDLII